MNEISRGVSGAKNREGLEDTDEGELREEVPVLAAALMGVDVDGWCGTETGCW